MKKVVLILIFTFVSIGAAFSQFDAQFSQYMFHNSAFNPAAVGEGEMIQITVQHRIQWLGMPNAGQTTAFSVNSPVKIGKNNHGIGINFLNDKVGQFTNQSAHLQYAYKKRIKSGTFSIGADVGFVNAGFNGDSIHKVNIGTYYDFLTDPVLPQKSVQGIGFDMNVGVYYSTPTYYAGLSYSHLNNPKVIWGDNIEFKETGTLYLTGGYNWVLADSKYIFKPSTLLKTDFTSLQLDISGLMEYDSKYWGGVSYRIQDAVVFLAGINAAGGLSIGFSYDLPTSQILTVSPASIELLVSYSFEYVFGERNKKIKSIRIL
jgi:type IX secretion system PorP/SprF family membrane protein